MPTKLFPEAIYYKINNFLFLFPDCRYIPQIPEIQMIVTHYDERRRYHSSENIHPPFGGYGSKMVVLQVLRFWAWEHFVLRALIGDEFRLIAVEADAGLRHGYVGCDGSVWEDGWVSVQLEGETHPQATFLQALVVKHFLATNK